jgi:hypothetical protein
MSSNTHIEEYLKYYCEMKHAPEFAVLLKGKWGAGKTWFIKKFQKENSSNKFLYISLYGVTSFKDVENEFFKQLHPILSSKGMALTSKIFKGALKATIKVDFDNDGKSDGSMSSQVPDINLPDYLKDAGERILIFDDLERCSIEIEIILGYINHFVEHQDMKCILIANEEEFFSEENKNQNIIYKRVKEKLIGKTLEILPDTNAAILDFIKEVSKYEYKEYLRFNIETIKDIYDLAGYKNLRHMKHAVWDFERLIEMIDSKYRDNPEFINQLIVIIFSYSFEIKSGTVLPSEIRAIEHVFYPGMFDEYGKNEIFDRMNFKYNSYDIQYSIFGSNFWEDFFGSCIISEEEMDNSIQSSRFFGSKSQPDWIKLWHCYDHDDDELQLLISKIESDFNNKTYNNIGIIKHIVGVLLTLSDINVLSRSKEDIVSSYEKVFLEMLEDGLITFEEADRYIFIENDTYDSYSYFSRDSSEFSGFCNFIKKAIYLKEKEKLPVTALSLMADMKEDVFKFSKKITPSGNDSDSLSKTPVLNLIPVEDFIDTYFLVSPSNRKHVFMSLRERYKDNYYNKYLVDEVGWLEELLVQLKKVRFERSGTMSGYLLDRPIEDIIPKAIKNLKKQSKEI